MSNEEQKVKTLSERINIALGHAFEHDQRSAAIAMQAVAPLVAEAMRALQMFATAADHAHDLLGTAPGVIKKPAKTPLTVARIQELFTYNADTGQIFHRANRRGGVHAGVAVGHGHPSGQKFISADRHRIAFHRAAWALHYGHWPDGMLDHINRDSSDNRIENLRIATQSQNTTNSLRHNRHGFRGVRTLRGKAWQAQIKVDGKLHHLGTFETIDEAAHAYNKAAIRLHGQFAILNPIGQDKDNGAAGQKGGAA